MAYTYSKIASVTVGSGGASSIDFLAIPQNYTDLIVKSSIRTSYAGVSDAITVSFNGVTTNLSSRRLYGTGASAASTNSGSLSYGDSGVGSTATANTFSNGELYIPNYAGSNYKSSSSDGVGENNATSTTATLAANLWSSSAAINSISLKSENGSTIQQYSTATLYGIKAEV